MFQYLGTIAPITVTVHWKAPARRVSALSLQLGIGTGSVIPRFSKPKGPVVASAIANIFEPVRPAIFLVKESFAVSEAARHAALALGRVGAVEEWNMLVSDISEPGCC
jgi:hypothetical protein